MPAYRLQVTPDNRKAGCQETLCKSQSIKILKHELRLGTWVEMEGPEGQTAGWRWKHWGCVSGFQLQNIREYLLQGGPPGEYQWEFMDGLDDAAITPEIALKFKTAVTEGKIADGDFKGDPEYNVLGRKGIRSAQSAARIKKDIIDQKMADGEAAIANPEGAELVVATPTPKKRGRAKKDEDGEDDNKKETKPPAKKRAKKPKKEEEDDDDDDDVEGEYSEAKPAPRKRAPAKRSAKKEEDNDDVKMEDRDDVVVVAPKPARKSRAKRPVQKEELDNDIMKKEENGSEHDVKAAPKKRGAAVKVKKEDDNKEEGGIDVKPVPKKKAPVKKATKKEESEGSVKEEQHDEATMDDVPEVGGVEAVKAEQILKTEQKPTVKKEEAAIAGSPNVGDLSIEDYHSPEILVQGMSNVEVHLAFEKEKQSGQFTGDWDTFLMEKRDRMHALVLKYHNRKLFGEFSGTFKEFVKMEDDKLEEERRPPIPKNVEDQPLAEETNKKSKKASKAKKPAAIPPTSTSTRASRARSNKSNPGDAA